MKKIIIAIISAMILMPSMAEAQIVKTGKSETITLSSVRMGYVNLKKSGDWYYLAMRTSNQFDDYMLLRLGNTKVGAIQSLNDLLSLLETLSGSECQRISNGYGEELRIYKELWALNFHADGYAGFAGISKQELKKFIKVIQKK